MNLSPFSSQSSLSLRLLFGALAVLGGTYGVAACSSDSEPTVSVDAGSDTKTDADAPADASLPTDDDLAQAYCATRRDDHEQCSNTQDEFDLAECVQSFNACNRNLYSTEALKKMTQCFAGQKGCGEDERLSDDECYAVVGAQLSANPVRDQYATACREKNANCAQFGNDWCGGGGYGVELFTDETYRKLSPCFERPCEEVRACLREGFDAQCPGGLEGN